MYIYKYCICNLWPNFQRRRWRWRTSRPQRHRLGKEESRHTWSCGHHVTAMWSPLDCHVVTTWLLWGHHVTAMGSLCNCHVVTTWLPCDHHVNAMWSTRDCHVVTTWMPCGDHVTAMWSPRDCLVVTIWLPCGDHLTAMWSSRDCNVVTKFNCIKMMFCFGKAWCYLLLS